LEGVKLRKHRGKFPHPKSLFFHSPVRFERAIKTNKEEKGKIEMNFGKVFTQKK